MLPTGSPGIGRRIAQHAEPAWHAGEEYSREASEQNESLVARSHSSTRLLLQGLHQPLALPIMRLTITRHPSWEHCLAAVCGTSRNRPVDYERVRWPSDWLYRTPLSPDARGQSGPWSKVRKICRRLSPGTGTVLLPCMMRQPERQTR